VVLFAATLVSTQGVFCGLVGREIDGVRGSCAMSVPACWLLELDRPTCSYYDTRDASP
jgi:hypothetical protein